MPKPDISIVVACRNEIGHISAMLESLIRQELDGISWEAIFADGMSNDGTRVVLRQYSVHYPQIRMIDNPRLIVSTGLNLAIRAARGPIVMRMDAHTTYAPDYCRSCLELLEYTDADNVGGPARTSGRCIRSQAVAAAFHSRFSTGGAHFHDPTFRGWVDTVPYGCWHKSTLERLGLFDERLVRNQDDEMNLRLVRAGGRIWQDPAIVSWYSPRPRLTTLFRQYFQYGFWKVAVMRKHHLPASWRHVVPAIFILLNASLVLAILTTAVLSASSPLLMSTTVWLGLLSIYGAALLAASVVAASQAGWATLPFLPAAFATFHLSYGLGFLFGLRWLARKPIPICDNSIFTSLSR